MLLSLALLLGALALPSNGRLFVAMKPDTSPLPLANPVTSDVGGNYGGYGGGFGYGYGGGPPTYGGTSALSSTACSLQATCQQQRSPADD